MSSAKYAEWDFGQEIARLRIELMSLCRGNTGDFFVCLITPDKAAEIVLFHIDSMKYLDLGSLVVFWDGIAC